MADISKRKLYGKHELLADFECSNFREAAQYRAEHFPNVALFTYTDQDTGERTVVMPREFQEQYEALSVCLFENGCEGKHLAVMGDNSYQFMLLIQSALCSRNTAVPLDKSLDTDTLGMLLQKSDSSVLFYGRNYGEKAAALKEKLGIEVYELEELGKLVSEGQKLIEAGKTDCLSQEIDNDAPSVIMFTSGTTGNHKGVMLSQRNIVSAAIMDNRQCKFFYDGLLVLPLHHAYGLTCAVMIYMMFGKTIHINRNMRHMFRDLQAENPEGLVCVPLHHEVFYNAIWKGIRSAGREEEIRAKIEENRRHPELTDAKKREMFRDVLGVLGSRMKALSSGGAPLNMEIYNGLRDLGIEIYQGYGITECSPIVSCNFEGGVRTESVGRILEGMEIRIDDPDKDKVGEICLKGPNVMLGYYKDEEATREVLQDGWFHTGDIGYIDEDNYIYLSGRKKNLIILANGENVVPEELEAKIVLCRAVKEVVVFEKNRRITAQIFADEEYPAGKEGKSPEDIIRGHIAKVNQSLPNFKQIGAVEFRRTPFVRNSGGKILRNSVE